MESDANLKLMLKLLRTQSKAMFMALFVIIGLSFVVFYNIPALDRIRQGSLGKIDGQPITMDQFRIEQQNTSLLFSLMYGGRIPRDQDSSRMINHQTWNRMLLLAGADQMGIRISEKQIVDYVQKLPFLQRDNAYQPELYQNFLRNFLQPQGITSQRFEQIVLEELKIAEMRKLISAAVYVPQEEVRQLFERIFSPIQLEAIRFEKAAFMQGVKVTPEEIEKIYNDSAHLPDYRTPEKRKVEVAVFRLDAKELAMPADKRQPALQALGEKAMNFSIALLGDEKAARPDFDALAQKAGAALLTTDYFALAEHAKPLPASPNLNREAFRLTPEEPFSNPVALEDGYYVLRWLDTQASQPLPLDVVKEKITKQLQDRKALERMKQEGDAVSTQLIQAVGKGTAFKAAAATLKFKVQDIPEFVPEEAQAKLKVADPRLIIELTQSLSPGTVSRFVSSENGGWIVYFEARHAASQDALAKSMPALEFQLLNERQGQAVEEWLRQRVKTRGTEMPKLLLEAGAARAGL